MDGIIQNSPRPPPRWVAHARRQATDEALGVTYGDRNNPTTVALFAPGARRVALVVQHGKRKETLPMTPHSSGVWRAQLAQSPRKLYGKAYYFSVDLESDGVVSVPDPYAELATELPDGGVVSRFADTRFRWRDRRYTPPAITELVIYETHVKDLSALTEHLPKHERGTYRGLRAKPVLHHLRRLGVALELLPIQEFDPYFGGHWGYATTFYNAPTVKYASKPHAANRQLKAAIDALHRNGIPVIMDVVYNHTANCDWLHFKLLDRAYYYRLTEDGKYDYNGAGTGNEFASERPMVRKLILDTLNNFVYNYHVDGFRFDLAALLDLQTLIEIDRQLPKRVFLIAEPWAYDHHRTHWGKEAMRGVLQSTRWAIWNDDFRSSALAFVTGEADSATRDKLMNGFCGSVYDGVHGFTARTVQSINSITSHDEYAHAHVVDHNPQRQFLASMVVLFAQGVPMLTQGHEFMHAKGGWKDSWDQDNEINWLNWALKDEHEKTGLVDAHVRAIALRKRLPHFKYKRPLTGDDILWIYPQGHPHDDKPNAIGFMLRSSHRQAARRRPTLRSLWQRLLRRGPVRDLAATDVLVLYNGDKHRTVAFSLPPGGRWELIIDGESLQVDEGGLHDHHGLRAASEPDLWYVRAGTGVMLLRHLESQRRHPGSTGRWSVQ